MKIAIGDMQKREVEGAVKKTCPGTEVIITTGMGAVSLLKDGRADYYFSTRKSGGSAAISTLIEPMGYREYCTVCKNGGKLNEEEICRYAKDGKICFGMTISGIDGTVPILTKVLPGQENH